MRQNLIFGVVTKLLVILTMGRWMNYLTSIMQNTDDHDPL